MSSLSESHASFFNSDYFTSISNDEDILDDMNEEDMAIFDSRLVVATPINFSHCMKLKKGWANPWMQELMFETFWLQCKPHPIFSKLWPTSPWQNLMN